MDDREKRECLAFAGWRVSADRSDSTQNSNRDDVLNTTYSTVLLHLISVSYHRANPRRKPATPLYRTVLTLTGIYAIACVDGLTRYIPTLLRTYSIICRWHPNNSVLYIIYKNWTVPIGRLMSE